MSMLGPSDKLDSIANKAFKNQTMIITKMKVKFTNSDVDLAHLAYEAYNGDDTRENLNKFQEAVAKCAENGRTGFKTLNQALLIEIGKLDANKNDQENKLNVAKKPMPK